MKYFIFFFFPVTMTVKQTIPKFSSLEQQQY